MYSKKAAQGEYFYFDDGEIESFRYNPYRKANREKAEQSYRSGNILDFPLHLIIEPTSNCNLDCVMCNRSVMTREICDLDYGLYKKAIDEGAKNGIHSVSLYALGEPLFHKKIYDMANYAKLKGISYVDLSTNATMPIFKLADTLLDEIIISIDGFAEQYEQMRPPAKYETVIRNTADLMAGIKRPKPIIRIQCIENELTLPIKDKFIQSWKGNKIVVYWKKLEYMRQNLGNKLIDEKNANNILSHRRPCKQLYYTLTVQADGGIAACCHDSGGKSVLGNISGMTLKEAWEKLAAIRNRHIKKDYTDFNGLCLDCLDGENW